MESIGVTVVSRYIHFLIILLIPIPLVLALFCSSIPTSLSFFIKCCFVLVDVIFVQYSKRCSRTFEIVQKSRSREHGDISISTRTCVDCARARVPRLPRARYRVTFQDAIMVS